MVGVIAVFLQWVRPRSSAMSIDVALSTRRGVGRDTYSLPQKRGCAASGTSMDMPPLHKRHLFFAAKTRLRPGAMSMDMALLSCAPGAMSTDFVFVTWIHSRCEEATTRFEAQDVLQPSAPSL